MKNLHTLDKFRCKDDELLFFGGRGGSGNGCFMVSVDGNPFFAVASVDFGGEHVSAEPYSDSFPTPEEVSKIRDMFFAPGEATVVRYDPPKVGSPKNSKVCVHIWGL